MQTLLHESGGPLLAPNCNDASELSTNMSSTPGTQLALQDAALGYTILQDAALCHTLLQDDHSKPCCGQQHCRLATGANAAGQLWCWC